MNASKKENYIKKRKTETYISIDITHCFYREDFKMWTQRNGCAQENGR